MARQENVREYVGLLGDEAQVFEVLPSRESAQRLLMLCECVAAAVTGYLIRQKMEEAVNGNG